MPDLSVLDRLATKSKTHPIWLRVGQLFDGERVLRDANVVFDAKHIHSVGVDAAVGLREPDAVLPDVTLLPCLIEAHAHMFLEGAPIDFVQREQYLKESPEKLLANARNRWHEILQTGVGAIRDAGDKHGTGLALAADAKLKIGQLSTTPFIDSPGAAIHHRGRYGAFMGKPIEDHEGPAACVASRVAEGADRIKLLVSGIINFKEGKVTAPPQMPINEVKALVAAAKENGRQTFAHASGTEGVEHSIEGGVNTIEHGFFITEDQLKKMRDRQIAWVPTFAPVQSQIDNATALGWDSTVVGHLKRIIEDHQQMLRKASEMGVKIVAGSDAGSGGVPHGVGFLDELVHMERAGMPAIAILRSATSVSGDVLQFPEKIGRISRGFRTRLILTRNDPLASIKNLHKDKTILFDGTVIDCPTHTDLAGL
jgi:imidazolonepropionase-like amidohydrolase